MTALQKETDEIRKKLKDENEKIKAESEKLTFERDHLTQRGSVARARQRRLRRVGLRLGGDGAVRLLPV